MKISARIRFARVDTFARIPEIIFLATADIMLLIVLIPSVFLFTNSCRMADIFAGVGVAQVDTLQFVISPEKALFAFAVVFVVV